MNSKLFFMTQKNQKELDDNIMFFRENFQQSGQEIKLPERLHSSHLSSLLVDLPSPMEEKSSLHKPFYLFTPRRVALAFSMVLVVGLSVAYARFYPLPQGNLLSPQTSSLEATPDLAAAPPEAAPAPEAKTAPKAAAPQAASAGSAIAQRSAMPESLTISSEEELRQILTQSLPTDSSGPSVGSQMVGDGGGFDSPASSPTPGAEVETLSSGALSIQYDRAEGVITVADSSQTKLQVAPYSLVAPGEKSICVAEQGDATVQVTLYELVEGGKPVAAATYNQEGFSQALWSLEGDSFSLETSTPVTSANLDEDRLLPLFNGVSLSLIDIQVILDTGQPLRYQVTSELSTSTSSATANLLLP